MGMILVLLVKFAQLLIYGKLKERKGVGSGR